MTMATTQLEDAGPPPVPYTGSRLTLWLAAIRPKTLPAALAPVFVGVAAAAADGHLNVPAAAAALAGALLLQIGTNLANDYSDGRRGTDAGERLGPPRVTQLGWLSARAVARAAAIAFGAAALVGVYLVARAGWPLLLVGLLSVAAGLAYTGGPRPYGYRGWGDLAVFVFFGPVAVCGSYYVQALQLGVPVVALSIGPGLLITAILVVNNIRDRASDARAGKRTLAVLLGLHASRVEYAGLVLLPYLYLPVLPLSGLGRAGTLLPLVSLPLALREVVQVWRRDGAALNASLASTARLGLIYATLLGAGILMFSGGGRAPS